LLSDEYHVLQNNITSPGHCFAKRTTSTSSCDHSRSCEARHTVRNSPTAAKSRRFHHSLLPTTPLIPYADIQDMDNHPGCVIRYKKRCHILARRAGTTHPNLLGLPVATLRESLLVRLRGRAVEHRAAAGRAGAEAAKSRTSASTHQAAERQPPTIKPQKTRTPASHNHAAELRPDTPPPLSFERDEETRGSRNKQYATSFLRRAGAHPPP